MNDLVLYVKESYNELIHKVTWPTWSSLIENSIVVLVASVIITIIIFIMDLISRGITDFLYSLGAS